MTTQTRPTMRWTRARYERAAELGLLADQRVELIGGQIVEMSPKWPHHAAIDGLVRKALETAFAGQRCCIRVQEPLALGEWDEPEPDLVVAVGDDRDYAAAHPTAEQVLLVVEVGVMTAAFDRNEKADVYAAAQIADYWVVDAEAGSVLHCRRAEPDGASETGVRYADRHEDGRGEQIAPPARGAAVAGAGLLLRPAARRAATSALA